MTTFSEALAAEKSAEIAYTENGAVAFATSDSAVLDLFGKIGSSRKSNRSSEFTAAFVENEELAIRTLLWARDVRGGAGERNQFRTLLRTLETQNAALAGRLLHKIPVLGRWDDVFVYQEAENRQAALAFYAEALLNGDKLAAKWAPRITSMKKRLVTASKAEKLKNANDLRRALKMTHKQYRQLLVANTEVVESAMCAKQWDSINFSHVPSLAAARYQKAFNRNATAAYAAYVRELQKPEAERNPTVKINAGAVYPYDVVKSLQKGVSAVADAQFAALPNYVGDAAILPMVDVSGSMGIQLAGGLSAMDVALSLGLYLSDRTNSDFKDIFMTFTNTPKMHKLKGTLSQKLAQMQQQVAFNTNIAKAFDSLLDFAVKHKIAGENMPKMILILSDMQFDDSSIDGKSETAFAYARKKYANAGYTAPNIVFWNLADRASANQSPIKQHDSGAALVSGFSPALMTSILSTNPDDFTPYNMMLKTIMNERYDF